MRKYLGLVLILLALELNSAPVTLVKDGAPCGAIIIASENATRAAQFAAFELQSHLKLITGATMPIVDDKAVIDGVRILVGESSATRALGIRHENFKGEEYAIKFLTGAIVLIGNDSPIYGKVDYQNCKTFPAIHFQEKSTLWAVYDFLESFCDVRWYAPTDTGTTFSAASTLVVEPKDIRRRPAMDAQRYLYATKFYYQQDKPFSDRDNILLKLRWRMTVRYGLTNHNSESAWYKYWGKAKRPDLAALFVEKHPEYFARNYDGSSATHLVSVRNQYPDDPNIPPQVCMSNPDVIRHFAEEAVKAYSGKFQTGNPDNQNDVLLDCPWYYPIVEDDNTAVCGCENCRKLFPDKNEKERKSLLHFRWVNQIANAAAKLDPTIGISTLAYGNSLYYPRGLKLEPNVGVMLTLGINNWWHPTVYKRHHDIILKDWTENEGGRRLLQVWTYMLTPGHDAKIIFKYNDFFPAFYASKVGPMFKEFITRGISGWFGQSMEDYGYPIWQNQLEVYVAARTCDNPELDTDKLVEEFFPRYYGGAAKPMREFYRIVEEAVWNKSNYPPEWFKDDNNIGPFGRMDSAATCGFYPEAVCWGRLGTKDRMDKLAKCMDEAKRLVKTEPEKQRLNWFDQGVWQPMLRGRAKYEAKEKLFNIPAPEITIPRQDKCDGNYLKVKWDQAASTGSWKTTNAFPDDPRRDLLLAHDGEFLYLKYFEPCDAAKLLSDKNNFWTGDTLEMFFAPEKVRPYHHLAVNPAGQTEALAYLNENGVDFNGKWTVRSKISSNCDEQGWTIYVVLPLNKILPDATVKSGATFYANFLRNSPKKTATSWSPIFSLSFHALDRMGKIHLAE